MCRFFLIISLCVWGVCFGLITNAVPQKSTRWQHGSTLFGTRSEPSWLDDSAVFFIYFIILYFIYQHLANDIQQNI